jgi:serine/threonine-protein kinase HipA
MGMQAWNTHAIKDDGVDAVAVNNNAVFGGMCIIQAKRYRIHAKNFAILHLPGRSELADVYDAVPNLFQEGRIDCNLALAIDGSFDHRRVSSVHLIHEAESWNALRAGAAEQVVTTTLADFAKALDRVQVPRGVPAAAAVQLAWNAERLQAGAEIGVRPSGYRRRRSRS